MNPVVQDAVNWLAAHGHTVERAPDIPGLFYVDNGPEITTRQLLHFASQLGWCLPCTE
jgi:hypothetical protein